MRSSVHDNEIKLFFEGRVDSSNAAQIESEAFSCLGQELWQSVVIDAEKLEYISSAGLRVLLKIAKSYKSMKIVNVNTEVYDILEMTGFSEMIPVERALRVLSIEGCPQIGQGSVGTIYQYDADTVVKVYREGTSLENLKLERERCRMALVKGVPTSISFDIVRVGNCYATVYEMVNSASMGRRIKENPACYADMAVRFGQVLRQLHEIDAADLPLPHADEIYRRAHKNLAAHFTDEENAAIGAWIDALPKGTKLIHGDFHPKNIMMQGDEPLLIDMGDISIGHPLYDLFTASFVIQWLKPARALMRSGVPRDVSDDFIDIFLRTYFATDDEAALAEIKSTIYFMGHVRAAVVLGIDNTRTKEELDMWNEDLRDRVFPHAEETLAKIRAAEALYEKYFPKQN